ncbi:hypothetical protein ACFYOV_12050 [Streptomyces sp. NPDC005931]|uniref:hypothetical protein n=1 Tax=Streptomyces sp. NPDC005931 TaxID=3364737 RepID=UPI0036B7CB26
MPGFHRPPEWQQPADRHTRLIDPVLTVRQLSRFEMSLKHVVRIDHALVFSTPKGGYEAYLPPKRPTRGEIAGRRYTAVYEVDMGVHPFTDTLPLPSDNDAFEFTAEVDVSWQVLDPVRFVASGIRDVPAMLLGELQRASRPVTRRFTIADSAAAEQELLREVTVMGPLGAPAGLQATWTLRLRRDQANVEHQQRLQAIDHSAAEQIRAAQQGMQVDAEMDHRYRQQDALQLNRAMEYGRREQELALQHQHWQHERALLQGQQALELQQLEAQKIEFYQWHLAQGGVHAWALHLAQHPEDSRLVMDSMREDQLRMIQAQMDLVKELLSGENAEKFELEGPKQLALRTVSDILNQRLPGVPQTPPLLPSPEGVGHDSDPSAPQWPTAPPEAVTAAPTAPETNGTGAPTPPTAAGPGSRQHHAGPGTPAGAVTTPGRPPSAPYTPPQVPYLPPQGPRAHPQAPYAPPPRPHAPPPPVPAAPSTAWQPPPGYGSTPSMPPQPAPGYGSTPSMPPQPAPASHRPTEPQGGPAAANTPQADEPPPSGDGSEEDAGS